MKNRRYLAAALAIMLVVALLQPVVYSAATDFVPLSGYTVPQSVTGVETSSTDVAEKVYAWKNENGVLRSGNANQNKTVSLLKITVTGKGALTFRYKVSPGVLKSGKDSTNSFLISKHSAFVDSAKKGYSELGTAVGKENYERIQVKTDWTWKTIPIEEAETTRTVYYLAYRTSGSACTGDDCVFIKDIAFHGGKVKISALSNDETLGAVSGGGEYLPGSFVTLKAAPASGARFYCWVSEEKVLSYDREYTFEAASDTEIKAVFAREDETIAENLRNGAVYSSLAKAVSEASGGDEIILLRDTVIRESFTVPKDVTLFVPFKDGHSAEGSADGNKESCTNLADETMAFRTLGVESGVSIDVEGCLRVGGVIGHPSQSYQGHTSGAFGRIENNGSINIKKGGSFDCFGFVDGTGTLTAEGGAEVFEPFIVYDYSGGTNTLKLYESKQSPFTQYTMQNIRCTLVITDKAVLTGRCNLYAGGEFNKTDVTIVGNSERRGIYNLKPNAVLKRTVNREKSCLDYCSDLGRVTYDISGGASFDALTLRLEAYGTTVSTEDVLFPLTYASVFNLNNGSYSIDTGMVLMPGAEMNVGGDAELFVNRSFYVLDGLRQGKLSGKSYPTTETLEKSGFSASGNLTVNGSMKIASGVAFGGIIQSKQEGARVITAGAPQEKADLFENTVTLGGKTTNGDNTATIEITGRIFDGEKPAKIESGKEYVFKSTSAWKLGGYTMQSYVIDGKIYGPETFPIKGEMYGSLKEDEPEILIGDLDFDGRIDSADARVLAEHLAGISELDEAQRAAADINKDGKVNSIDSTILAKYLAGIITDLG